jgi:hydroxyacylglutathione hydrolase
MAFELTPLPAFQDNYIWMLSSRDSAAVVDPGDAEPVRRALAERRLRLAAVLITHHHTDHMGGAAALAAEHGCPVFGPTAEHIPAVGCPLREGMQAEIPSLGLSFGVLDIPGHTAGHIAYQGHGIMFCGDTLFSAGCGRLFEGTAGQMCKSLDKLAALADATAVCCGHEYTLANLRFAGQVEPHNPAIVEYAEECRERRARGEATLPSLLGRERRVNPFLRCGAPAVRAAAQAHAGHALQDGVAVFTELRAWKDGFS